MGVAKVSKPLGEAHTKDYPREQQNAYYYTEGAHAPGTWHGKLAEKWGLVGPIDMAHYDLLAAGKHPHTEEQLIKHRLPAPDPKLWEPKWLTDHVAWEEHVRNLWALGERAQLPEGVREFMDEVDPLELDPVEFRVVPPGKPEKEAKAPSLHVASWDVVVSPHKSYSASALVGGDKRIVDWHNRAVTEMLDAGELYAQTRMGKARLPYTTGNWAVARFVHDTSRPVENRAPDPQLHTHCVIMNMTDADGKVRALLTWEIFAIQSYMNAVYEASLARQAWAGGFELEHGKNFSTRIKGYSDEYLESISARTNEIEAEKERRGVTGAAADEIINKALRQPKQEWDPGALKAEHRRQAEEFGQHPERIVAESKARQVHILSPAELGKRAHRSIDHARDRLFEHQAVNDHYELMRDALRAGLGHLRLQDVEEAFAGRQEFVRVGHYRENAPGARYTTKAMQQMERQSIEVMLAGKGTVTPIAPDLTADEFRERYQERKKGDKVIIPNGGQMRIGFNVLTSPHQGMLVFGAAGTGKTTSLEPIAEVAREQGYTVIGMASASKAAENLRTLGIEPMTIQAHNHASVDPSENKRLYILDEGSLIGTRQFYTFLRSIRPEDRYVVAGDLRQHQSVEAGRIIEEMKMAGVPMFQVEKIVRQRNNPALLEVVNDWKEGRITEGLKKLDEQAHVWQVPDRKKRFQAMAQWYAAHDDTLMVAPDNRSIAELNAAARVEMRKVEKLGADRYEATILVGTRDVREADRKLAVMYEAGNVIRWGKGVAMLGVKSGDYTPVVRTDTAKNLVTIDVYGVEKTYNPRLAYGVEIYNAERRKLAVGERVQITRPWRLNKNERIPNRAMTTIKALDAKGRGVLEFEDGRKVRWDARAMPHVDYSYAMTSYSLQYATAENVLLHLDTGDSRIRSLMDKSLVYVGGSRAAQTLHVFTDDRATLLGENSPALRQQLKPKALAEEEIRGYAVGVAS
jgi:conjugative relaxase-like TrwC/TraI family protein